MTYILRYIVGRDVGENVTTMLEPAMTKETFPVSIKCGRLFQRNQAIETIRL